MSEVNKGTDYGVSLTPATIPDRSFNTGDNHVPVFPVDEKYYTDAYGLKLFHDAMDGNIVTPDSIRAAEYVRQLRAANAAKAQAAAKADANANAAKTQANTYDPSIRLNNNVQYVINTLKTYGYPQQVLDSFKQNIGKILANTKDNNRIDTANQYIDQFLGDKQDLRRQDPAPNQQPQSGALAPAPADVTAAVMKAVKADGNTSFANWRQSLVNQGWDGDPSKIKYDPSTGKFMSNGGGQAFKGTGKPALDQQPQKAGNKNKSGKKPRMSDDEIDAFLEEELGNGTYASPGVAKGGTYASPGISSGGTYATGEGIKDANGNVLTNPGGDWEYQLALRDPQYGLGMMSKMSDAQKNYLQAVSDDMGYKYNFRGAPRYV